MHPNVAVVVLNYNGGRLLKRCVESFTQLSERPSVIVVDNASTDGSIELLDEFSDQIKVISSETNLGYTGGNNVGIRLALEQNADYVLVVNADTVVLSPSFLSELVNFGNEHPNAGIIGPRVYFQTTERVQNTVCQVPRLGPSSFWWVAQKIGWHRAKSGGEILEAPVLNGVCILLRAEMLKKIGLFDYDIFMYREDTDLALRARRHGWKIFYVPIDSILHLQKSEGYDYTGMANFLLKRNAVHVLRKHGMTLDALAMALATGGISFVRACIASVRGQKVRENWRFVAALSRALKAALLDRVDSSEFGPPHRDWATLMGSTSCLKETETSQA